MSAQQKADEEFASMKEVLDNIENVKGKNYAILVRHTVGLNMLMAMCDNPDIQQKLAMATASTMSDLALAYGIDLTDTKVAVELRRNIQAAMPKCLME